MDSPVEANMKFTDEGLQLDVDTLMLDFLLDAAIKAALEDRNIHQSNAAAPNTWSEKTERAVASVDSCLEVFQSKYTSDNFSKSIHFRLNLLKFITFFCRRLVSTLVTPSQLDLVSLRDAHQKRSRKWTELSAPHDKVLQDVFHSHAFPLAANNIQQCRAHILGKFSIPESSADHYGTEACMSLLDLLPFFMHLSADRAQLDADFGITRRWMDLAGEFMLQSALEAYLCFGAGDAEVAEEAFAWGYLPQIQSHEVFGNRSTKDEDETMAGTGSSSEEEVWEGEVAVNRMFTADLAEKDLVDFGQDPPAAAEHREIDGWTEVREEYIDKLRPETGSDPANHLIHLAAEYPLFDFEAKITSYLIALSNSIEPPVLVQLEQGQLAGLSVEETNEFKRKVGLDPLPLRTAS